MAAGPTTFREEPLLAQSCSSEGKGFGADGTWRNVLPKQRAPEHEDLPKLWTQPGGDGSPAA